MSYPSVLTRYVQPLTQAVEQRAILFRARFVRRGPCSARHALVVDHLAGGQVLHALARAVAERVVQQGWALGRGAHLQAQLRFGVHEVSAHDVGHCSAAHDSELHAALVGVFELVFLEQVLQRVDRLAQRAAVRAKIVREPVAGHVLFAMSARLFGVSCWKKRCNCIP